MGSVTRNHLEAFTLLFQDEFRSQGFDSRGASRGHGICVSKGNTGKGCGIYASCGNCAANENCQLARDAAQKRFPVALHSDPLDQRNAGWQEYIPGFVPIAYYFCLARRIDSRGAQWNAQVTRSKAVKS